MKSVQIGELKNHLSAHLREVRKGEEIIVRDRHLPVARIIPYVPESIEEQERMLIAQGVMKPPKNRATDRDTWVKEFLAKPRPKVSRQAIMRAILEEREEGY